MIPFSIRRRKRVADMKARLADLRAEIPRDDEGFVSVRYGDGDSRNEPMRCPWCKRLPAQGHWAECEWLLMQKAITLAEEALAFL